MRHSLKRFVGLIGLAGILSSCSYRVPDINGCIQLSSGGAFCQTLVSERETRVSRARWARERIGSVCYSPSDAERIIDFIETVCQREQSCVRDIDERIERGRASIGQD